MSKQFQAKLNETYKLVFDEKKPDEFAVLFLGYTDDDGVANEETPYAGSAVVFTAIFVDAGQVNFSVIKPPSREEITPDEFGKVVKSVYEDIIENVVANHAAVKPASKLIGTDGKPLEMTPKIILPH